MGADLEFGAAPAAPSLSFGAEAQAQEAPAPAATAAAPEKEQTNGNLALEAQLTAEELKQVEDFSKQIDISNTTGVMNYGVGTQKKLADFSEKAIENVRTKDMGEVGNMITDLVTELKGFEIEEDEKGIRALFKKSANKFEGLKAKYAKAEVNVQTIANELEKHQVTLLKDVDVLDKMYDLNLNYYKELTMYILAGKKRLEEERNTTLVELQNKAQASGLPEDAEAAKDFANKCDRFEKKLYDLELTRTIAMQTGPQIRMVQSSDTMMAEKIQSTIVNTIPLWKNQMVIAMGIEHATQAARAEREVNDMTNNLLRKNADALKVATIESAKEAERGIVDIETLKHTNESLISTLDEVLRIQTEGKQKRHEAEAELSQIENQLKDKLLEAAKN
ncbi:MAG: toxic anion resistance protein [Butyrivibrio sp.]|uniref:toxic anion resistance protein n=1 Tax=Butyrivibrio sp. TaxID=28121 RepID=UPI001B587B4C|nr:toxic anion resistance protein [Butyrivibrio sp.]MBP3273871.1 toxic anion resistance protein [Butyrivibrio sp.]MBP3783183.1 toxic anion resistance protein [Butyrivibrio sp.]MBP3813350.1 toxic anion resistance protein [Butyrivibrio sp.]